jgi:hypothetical protein
MGRGNKRRKHACETPAIKWKLARIKTYRHLQQLKPVESMCIATGKAVLLPQEQCCPPRAIRSPSPIPLEQTCFGFVQTRQIARPANLHALAQDGKCAPPAKDWLVRFPTCNLYVPLSESGLLRQASLFSGPGNLCTSPHRVRAEFQSLPCAQPKSAVTAIETVWPLQAAEKPRALKGHDFSRAAKAAKRRGLQPLRECLPDGKSLFKGFLTVHC